MGTSHVPNTAEAMDSMERLLSCPMPAGADPAGRLGGLLDSDNLADMLGRAAEAGKDVDVRPVVALELDEYVNWTACKGWPDDVVARGRALVERFRDADIASHVDRLVMPDTPEDASRRVAEIIGLDIGRDAARLDVRRGFAPGSFVVKDTRSGEMFRTESVYGVVFDAVPEVRERVEAEIFAPSPPAP